MKVMITKSVKGISRPDGAATMTYNSGQEYEAHEEWQAKVLAGFVRMGVAHEIGGNAIVPETKKTTRKTRKPYAKKG